jgi:uncharacterized membrane protein
VSLARIGQAGWALGVVWAAVLVTWGVLEPDPYAGGWRLVLELAFLGHIVSIADGTAAGFGHWYLLVQTGMQDTVLLLIALPVVVAAYEGAVRRGGLLGRWLDAVRRTAESQKGMVEPLGAVGLWAFVVFPFWSTGTLIGGVVGYLLGMRVRVILLAVLSGYWVSVVVLIWAFDLMAGMAEALDIGVVRYLPWIVVALLLAGSVLRGWRRQRRAAGAG